jgi:hypothetical protein
MVRAQALAWVFPATHFLTLFFQDFAREADAWPSTPHFTSTWSPFNPSDPDAVLATY